MTPEALPAQFSNDARWLVQAIDPRASLARLVDMDAAAYRAASFLDDRMLAGGSFTKMVALDAVFSAASTLDPAGSGWIFHIGHVGSTLVSRLLGEWREALALREPRSLRDLTFFGEADRPAACDAVRRLMGRAFAPDQRVIVKATSFVSELAPQLIGADARALLLYASPKNYVASILAGPNSRVELNALESTRRQRLAARGVDTGDLPTDAHRAAATWLTEMLSLQAAAAAVGDRALWFDFDSMLVDMTEALSRVAAHFGLPVDHKMIREIAEGPLMARYSKALEFDYSPGLRRDLLAEAGRQHRDDIERALGWLHDMVGRHPDAAPLANFMA
ncbi:hypothetical protein [Sphingomonas jaspsi]|uniref:hypothetical protein n=1 Tax=Sphingomonas jaspsi TaxID=392409 RepID=UPI0004B3FF78|nr:hypothetical protein [Sphingomonas jaspsi]